MAKGNPHAKGDSAPGQVQGGFMTKSPPARPVAPFMSKSIPAGSEGTNSGAGRKGQGR